jgi:hypothetical protein
VKKKDEPESLDVKATRLGVRRKGDWYTLVEVVKYLNASETWVRRELVRGHVPEKRLADSGRVVECWSPFYVAALAESWEEIAPRGALVLGSVKALFGDIHGDWVEQQLAARTHIVAVSKWYGNRMMPHYTVVHQEELRQVFLEIPEMSGEHYSLDDLLYMFGIDYYGKIAVIQAWLTGVLQSVPRQVMRSADAQHGSVLRYGADSVEVVASAIAQLPYPPSSYLKTWVQGRVRGCGVHEVNGKPHQWFPCDDEELLRFVNTLPEALSAFTIARLLGACNSWVVYKLQERGIESIAPPSFFSEYPRTCIPALREEWEQLFGSETFFNEFQMLAFCDHRRTAEELAVLEGVITFSLGKRRQLLFPLAVARRIRKELCLRV